MSQTTPSTPSRPCMQLLANLCHYHFTLSLMALIDLGAEDSFLDENLTLQSGIPLKPLESLLTVSTLDGRFLARVAHIDWSKKMISWSPFSLPVHACNPSFCQQRSLLYNPNPQIYPPFLQSIMIWVRCSAKIWLSRCLLTTFFFPCWRWFLFCVQERSLPMSLHCIDVHGLNNITAKISIATNQLCL